MPQDSASDQPFPLGDEPIEKLDQDGLDWHPYVFALLRRLEAGDTPFVLGVFGGWGSGKTSFLNMLGDAAKHEKWPRRGQEEDLDPKEYTEDHDCDWRVIRVNPWECDTPEDAKRLLASSLWAAFFNESRWLTWRGTRRRLRILGRRYDKAAVAAIDAAAKTFKLQGVGDAVEALFSSDASLAMQMRLYFEQDLASVLDLERERLLVLIDDLDRCQRKVIPEVLETIKLYLNQKGCVFVLGADPDAVADAIRDLYKPPEGQPRRITGTDYLEKIIQLPFHLPRLDEQRTERFFARCEGLLYEERPILPDMRALLLEHIFRGNPRAMKRFCMTHGLIAEIGPNLDPDKLATVLAIQMAFPVLFQAYRFVPRLLFWDQYRATRAQEPGTPTAPDAEQEDPSQLFDDHRDRLPSELAEAYEQAFLDRRLQRFLAEVPEAAHFVGPQDPEPYFSYTVIAAPSEAGTPQGLDGALAMLRSDNPEARAQAARALGEIRDRRAVEPLIAALREDDTVVRRRAALALGKIGDPRTIDPLISAFRDDDALVPRVAARALGEIGDPRAIDPLLSALDDDDANVRSLAARALGGIGDARAVDPLIAALRDDDAVVRDRAAWALGLIADARGVDPLLTALGDDDAEVRGGAASALGRIGDARAVQPLIAALEDENADVRYAAAWNLGEIADERAAEGLADSLYDDHEQVREAAAVALRAIGPITVPYLTEVVETCDDLAAPWAAELLGQFGAAQAVGPLTSALACADLSVRSHVATALGEIGAAAHSALSTLREMAERDPEPDVRDAAAEAIQEIEEALASEESEPAPQQ